MNMSHCTLTAACIHPLTSSPAPSAPPVDFTCTTQESDSEITLTWGEPPQSMTNGIIRSYTVTHHPFNLSEEATETIIPVNVTSLTLTNLTSMTPYVATIQAITVAPGPPATVICLTGMQS